MSEENVNSVENKKIDKKSRRRIIIESRIAVLNILLVSVIIVGGFGYLLFFKRDTISKEENRKLATFPKFTLESYFNGEYTEAVANFYDDTVPNRSFFKNKVAFLRSLKGKSYGDGDDNIVFYGPGVVIEDEPVVTTITTTSTTADTNITQTTVSENTTTVATTTTTTVPDNFNPPVDNGMISNNIVVVNNRGLMLYGGGKKNGQEYANSLNEYKKALGEGVNVYSMVCPTSVSYYMPENYAHLTASEEDNINNINSFLSDVKPVDVFTALLYHKKENIYATIINPQVCDYPNKNLCGAAVIYKVLQYLDEQYKSSAANEAIDLVGVAMVADVMDLRNQESRYLTTRGLMNIENKLIRAVIEKNAYNISNVTSPNALDAAFYISPMLNACIRTGSDEEQDNLFRAFIEKDMGQTFPYTPRKSAKNPNPVEIDEDFYAHVVRICNNLKLSKQDKVCEKECVLAMDELSQKKETKLAALNRSGMDLGLIGVLANKVANTASKPTLVLRRDREEDGKPVYRGSARNFKNSYVMDFKQDLIDSGLVISAAGHANAFGVEIFGENVKKLVEWFDAKYDNVDATKTFFVDYIMDGYVPYYLIREINEMKSLFSNFVETPFIACQNIQVRSGDIQILESQNGNKRFRFVVDDVEYLKFKLPEDDEMIRAIQNSFGDEVFSIDLVGKVSVSMFGGHATPQVMIEAYNIEVIE